jgi:phage gpG-like protein
VAGIGIRGDSARLAKLVGQLGALDRADVMHQVAQGLADESLYQLRQEFRNESDPYGEPWAPLKRRKGRILRDTGRLANSFARTSVSSTGFRVETNVDYAGVHQNGASYVSKPRLQPVNRKGRYITHDAAGKRKGRSVPVRATGGTPVRIPQRAMVPVELRGLGNWAEAYERTARRIIRRNFTMGR